MNDPPIEPLSPALAEILERESRAYPEDGALKADVLSHLEARVGLASPPGSPGSPPSPPPSPPGSSGASGATSAGARALAGVGLSAFLAGGILGGAIVRRIDQVSLAAPAAIVSMPPARRAAPASTAAPARAAEAPASEETPSPSGSARAPAAASPATASVPAAASPATASAPAAAPRGDLILERELLDAAHAALVHGRPSDALAAAERHAKRWPRGYLSEERAVVTIRALAASGRHPEAAREAAQFRKAHPKSMLLPVVDAAVPREKIDAP